VHSNIRTHIYIYIYPLIHKYTHTYLYLHLLTPLPPCVSQDTYACAHTHTHSLTLSTGWRRPIGCLIFIGHFPQKSPIIRGSFAKMTCNLRHPMDLRHRVSLSLPPLPSLSLELPHPPSHPPLTHAHTPDSLFTNDEISSER